MKIHFSRRTIQMIAGVVGIAIIFFIVKAVRSGTGEYEEVSVTRDDLTEEVVLSGSVEARIVAELGFEVSGTVQSISVTENDTVARGARLAGLSLGTLFAELQSAQATAAIKRAQVTNTAIDVSNALSELLSDDLVAEPGSVTYTQTPPIITGRYSGSEGTYKLRIEPQAQRSNYNLFVFGLETVGPTEVDKTSATALGTRGLFVRFPDELSTYRDTTWYVTIPNTKGTSYATNYATYQQVQADSRVQEGGFSVVQAELLKAEADVARVQAQIAQRTLVAPFAGVVRAVSADLGEAVSANSPVVSLISNDGFGVEVDLPEIDSVKVNIGDPVSITLDAFGESVVFSGTVVSVNRAETMVDNVAVYEARVAFNEADSRIASGMTAEVVITTDMVSDVLTVPVRAVKYHEDGTTYVMLKNPQTEEAEERTVVTGLRSSDGFFEIRTGLVEGDTVLIAS